MPLRNSSKSGSNFSNSRNNYRLKRKSKNRLLRVRILKNIRVINTLPKRKKKKR